MISKNIDWTHTTKKARLFQEVHMVPLLGVLAGLVSTTVGVGGGQLLTIGLAAAIGPWEALTWTGPALLVGNAHRLWMFRASVVWSRVLRFIAGAVPGALIGGLVAGAVPTRWLSVAMAVLAVLALARQALGSGRLSKQLLLPGGFLVGGVAATAGGAGVVAAPLWRGTGAEGDVYIACMAAGAGSVHIARMLGYGATGDFDLGMVGTGLMLAVCVMLGNAAGKVLRGLLNPVWRSRFEVGAVVACAVVAVVAALR